MTVMDVKLTCATMGGGGKGGGGGRWYWEEGAGNHYVPIGGPSAYRREGPTP